MIVTLYNFHASKTAPVAATEMTWPEFTDAIADLIARPSQAAPRANTKAQKIALFAWAPHRLAKPYRLAANVEAVTLLAVDIDACDYDVIADSITAVGIAAIVYESPNDPNPDGSRRLRVISPITRELVGLAECDGARLRFAELLGLAPGCGVDGALGLERVFFAGALHGTPAREMAVFDGAPVDVDALLAEPLEHAWGAATPRAEVPSGAIAPAAEDVIGSVIGPHESFRGRRHDLSGAVAGTLRKMGLSAARAEALGRAWLREKWSEHGAWFMGAWEVGAHGVTGRAALESIVGEGPALALAQTFAPAITRAEAEPAHAFPVIPFAVNKNGPLRTIDNVCLCIDAWLGGNLRLEVTRGRTVIAGSEHLHLPDGCWEEEHTIELTRLCEQHGLLVSPQTVHAAVKSHAKRMKFNAVEDYLIQCAEHWDGVPRVDTALTRLWGGEDCEAVRVASRILFLSLAARGLEPGCQADYCVTFVGDQGRRKSTSWRALLGHEWFSSSELPLGNKDAHMQMRGKLLWEFAERAGVSQRDRNQAKQFLTDPWATYRAAYGHYSEDVPRMTVFVATTNDEEFLDDPTGNRRFPCVRVVRGADIRGIHAERKQLLGEAAARVAGGQHLHPDAYSRPAMFTWWPTDAEEAVLDAYRAPHVATDPWDERVESWADKQTEPFSTALALALGVGIEGARMGRREMARGVSVLKRLGYQHVTINGRKRWRR